MTRTKKAAGRRKAKKDMTPREFMKEADRLWLVASETAEEQVRMEGDAPVRTRRTTVLVTDAQEGEDLAASFTGDRLEAVTLRGTDGDAVLLWDSRQGICPGQLEGIPEDYRTLLLSISQ